MQSYTKESKDHKYLHFVNNEWQDKLFWGSADLYDDIDLITAGDLYAKEMQDWDYMQAGGQEL